MFEVLLCLGLVWWTCFFNCVCFILCYHPGNVCYLRLFIQRFLLLTWPEISHIWARAAVCGFLQNNIETYMAAKERAVGVVNYVQLHSLSSVILYDTSSEKLKRGKFYNVERVIERRKTKHVRYSDDFVFAKMELEVHYFTLILTHNTINVWDFLYFSWFVLLWASH